MPNKWEIELIDGSKMESILKIRPNYIDYSKVIGIFFVVLSHFPSHFQLSFSETPIWWAYHTIVLFNMPLFFIVSGMLMKDTHPRKGFITKVLRRLVIPYFIICGICLVLGFLIRIIQGQATVSFGILKQQLISILMISDSGYYDIFSAAMWFCIALAWIQLFFAFSGSVMRVFAILGG